MAPLTLKWNKDTVTIHVTDGMSVEDFKCLIYSETSVPPERQKILGLGGGAMLKDSDNLTERIAKTKPNAKVQLLGTADEVKQAAEKTKFVEDMTAQEKAKLLKEKRVEILPSGLTNLGNTCFANSTLHVLKSVPQFKQGLSLIKPNQNMQDTQFVNSLRTLFIQLENTTDTVSPNQFIMSMRSRFPQFAQQSQQGGFQQQDAEEFQSQILAVIANVCKATNDPHLHREKGGSKVAITNGSANSSDSTDNNSANNIVDELFGFKMKSTYKCLESEEEPIDIKSEDQRIFICHLGTATEQVNHLHEGVKLSLKEHIEKNTTSNGPLGGRSAQWEKTACMSELPPYLFIQIARFGYKAACEISGVEATRVKHVRKCSFSPTLDVFDYCSPELQEILKVGRLKAREKKEDDDERRNRWLDQAFQGVTDKEKSDPNAMEIDSTPNDSNKNKDQIVPSALSGIPEGEGYRKDYVNNPDTLPLKDFSTGQYELTGIISHKGRSAEGGHYVSWVRHRKATDDEDEDLPQPGDTQSQGAKKKKTPKGSDVDTWYCYDDEDVTAYKYKDITGINIDLQGGRADTQIAYLLLYKRSNCVMPDCPPKEITVELAKKEKEK